MKIRTKSELASAIDSDLGWRKKELRYMSSKITNLESDAQITYLRASVALLYAHWEGFVVAALRAYIEFVSAQRITFEQLKPELRVAVIRTELRELEGNASNKFRANLLRAYENAIGKTHKLKADSFISAESNLNSERFLGLLSITGLDTSDFSSASIFLDEALLEKRNSICHGERSTIDSTGYKSTEQQVITLLEQLKTAVLNSATLGTYKNN